MNSSRAVAAVLLVLVLLVVRRRGRRAERRVGMRLVADAAGNEALVTEGEVGTRKMLFMVDTAYAGPPVLSTSYLAVQGREWFPSSVEERYRAVADGLRHAVTAEGRNAALARLLSESGCRSYASGCTMRLMGIGETTEAQADLLLCDGVAFRGEGGGVAETGSDVFVSNPLPTSVHILTMDFLLHRSPCLLLMREEVMVWRAGLFSGAGFHFLTPTLVGGAMRVPMAVGGTTLQIVVDTGAAAPLSLSPSAVERLTVCGAAETPRKATQVGVNGERVCSDVFRVRVRVGPIDVGAVDAFANSHDVEGADGYAGIGLLRALDLHLSPGAIGFRASGLPPSRATAVSEGKCGKAAFAPRCMKGE